MYDDTIRQQFLDHLRDSGNRTQAARAAGLRLTAIDRWRKTDAQFAEAYDEALEEAADMLEVEARRRAVEGVERVRYDKDGKIVARETLYSDSLLSKLLDGAKPDKYKLRTASELTGAGGEPLNPQSDTTAAARLVSILEAARQRIKLTAEIDPLT